MLPQKAKSYTISFPMSSASTKNQLIVGQLILSIWKQEYQQKEQNKKKKKEKKQKQSTSGLWK